MQISVLPAVAQQREGAFWLFGNRRSLDFNYYPPKLTHVTRFSEYREPGAMYRRGIGAFATICNPSGQLLFSVQSNQVYNKNNEVMKGGADLLSWYPDRSTFFFNENDVRNLPIIVKPKNLGSIYWIFYVAFPDDEQSPLYKGTLFRAVIDMKRESGFGEVISKNELIDTSVARQLAVCMHANGEDMWLINHNSPGVDYKVYLITDTLNRLPVVSQHLPLIGEDTPWNPQMGLGDNLSGPLISSPNSELLVSCANFAYLDSNINVFRFNGNTGALNKLFSIAIPEKPVSYTFSSNSKMLYVVTGYDLSVALRGVAPYPFYFSIYQVNLSILDSATVQQSIFHLPQTYCKSSEGTIMLGPDGKIYLGESETNTLDSGDIGVINYPDRAGLSCNFDQHGIRTPFYQFRFSNGYGFPILNQTLLRNTYKFQAGASADTVCLGDSVTLYAYGAELNNFTWDSSSFLSSLKGGAVKALPSADTVFWVSGGNGLDSSRASVRIKVIERPAPPLIAQRNDTIYAYNTNCSRFMWYVNDTLYRSSNIGKIFSMPGTTYRVQGIGTGKCPSEFSNMVVGGEVTGMALNGLPGFKVSPNPNNGLFRISSGSGAESEYCIVSMIGSDIAKGKLTAYEEKEISMGEASAGIYILKVTGPGLSGCFKLVKK